jgi:DegV family protein with EDD domain
VTIRIVTDSTCDLPDQLVSEFDITVVPLYINVGDESYLDGVDITREQFYNQLPSFTTPPMTATPGIDMFLEAYNSLALQGATEIISIHVSISLSATVDVARAAAEEFQTIPVTVFDSQQLSMGTGFLILAAAKAIREGKSISELIELLDDLAPRTYVIAALDTLEYLKRSGRMNSVIANLGNLLNIKPILKMHAGEPTAERVRTRKRAINHVIDFVRSLGPLEQIALVHTNAPQDAQLLYQNSKDLFSGSEAPLSVNVTPVLGAHIGPGAVGFSCRTAK